MSADLTTQTTAVAGSALPLLKRHVNQASIDAYAEASGDFNPIHVDPDYAKSGPFGRTIAHGLMTLAFAAELLNKWSNDRFDEEGEIDIAFVGPLFAGETVEVGGEVEEAFERDGASWVRVKLLATAGERRILVGIAVLPAGS